MGEVVPFIALPYTGQVVREAQQPERIDVEILPAIPGHQHIIDRTGFPTCGCRPYPGPLQIEPVEKALQVMESEKGGAVHPIRSIPLDMVAASVYREAGINWNIQAAIMLLDSIFLDALRAVCYRYDPPREHPEMVQMSTEIQPGGGVMTPEQKKVDGE